MTITPWQSSEMSVPLWISLILIYPLLAGSSQKACKSFLPASQESSKTIWKLMGESVVIQCDVQSNCLSNVLFRWFVLNASGHHELNLKSMQHKYTSKDKGLTIKSLSTEDDGVYVCAVVHLKLDISGAQKFGLGTLLVVRGIVWPIVLYLLFTLFAIYDLVLIIVIFRKQIRPLLNPCKKMHVSPKKSNSTRRLQFRCVVQELYNRRNLHSPKADKGSREEQPHKAEGIQSNPSNDDLYQNL